MCLQNCMLCTAKQICNSKAMILAWVGFCPCMYINLLKIKEYFIYICAMNAKIRNSTYILMCTCMKSCA